MVDGDGFETYNVLRVRVRVIIYFLFVKYSNGSTKPFFFPHYLPFRVPVG